MDIRRRTINVLGALGAGLLALLAFIAWRQGISLGEAGGWLAAGLLSLREIVSKLENVALNIRVHTGDAEGEALP